MTSSINGNQRNRHTKAKKYSLTLEASTSLVLYLRINFVRHRHIALALYSPASQWYLLYVLVPCETQIHCGKMQFLGAFASLRKATVSFIMSARLALSVCLSICPSAWYKSTPTGRIFMQFYLWVFFFFESLPRKFQRHWNLTRITGTLREDWCIFMIISRWILRRMMFLTKVVEESKIHMLRSKIFSENRGDCEVMWNNMVQPDRPQMT